MMINTKNLTEFLQFRIKAISKMRLGLLWLFLPLVAPSVPHAEGFAVKEIGKFKAFAAFVKDEDWKEKWYTPSDNVNFSTTDSIRVGEELTFLVGFANPTRDADGRIKILCDLEITRSDGSSGGSAHQIECASPDLPVATNRIVPTYLSVTIKSDPAEPVGDILFKAAVIDAVADLRLELELVLTNKGSK